MKKKTEIAIELYLNKEIKAALRIASDFRLGISEEERKQMKRGYECMVHPDFYKMLGLNVEKEISVATNIFVKKIYKPDTERMVKA